VFPEDPYSITPTPPLTKDLYKEWQVEVEGIITKGKSALESQRIVVDRGTFENVLDAAHTKYHITVPISQKPVTGTALLAGLARLEPEPFEGCRRLLAETVGLTTKLTPKASEFDIADAYGPMTSFIEESLGDIQRRLGAAASKTLTSLLKQSPSQVVESVRTYFLVPFQRLTLGFKPQTLKVREHYKLPSVVEDAVNDSLEKHLAYLLTLQKSVKGFTEIKLKQACKQLQVMLKGVQDHVRPQLVPGGAVGSQNIVSALVLGVLAEFVNPNVVPDGVSGTGGAVETTSRIPLSILEVCLSRLQLEGLNFTEDEIRDLIARRNDAEKILFVTRQDKMTPEEKKADLMMKRLGLGQWSVGGTKAVYTLDPDQLDREREQRIEMGLGDFALDPDAAANAAAVLQDDAFGGGGAGAEGGYDNEQQAADDY
jgi:hypothetical protein